VVITPKLFTRVTVRKGEISHTTFDTQYILLKKMAAVTTVDIMASLSPRVHRVYSDGANVCW